MIRLKAAAIALLGIAIGAVAVRDKPEPVLVTEDRLAEREEWRQEWRQEWEVTELPTQEEELTTAVEPPTEEWYGTDCRLTAYEWDIMGQVIMAEARGESHEVHYYIACVILNRMESGLFPNTAAGVIYQTNPIQFCGAWDTEQYEVSDSVLEAIQEALIHNDLPEDVFYFTSEGYLPNTEPYVQVGNMWFSRQR